jgi:hypothetical protein
MSNPNITQAELDRFARHARFDYGGDNLRALGVIMRAKRCGLNLDGLYSAIGWHIGAEDGTNESDDGGELVRGFVEEDDVAQAAIDHGESAAYRWERRQERFITLLNPNDQ